MHRCPCPSEALAFAAAAAPAIVVAAALKNKNMMNSPFAMHPLLACAGFSTILSGVYVATRDRFNRSRNAMRVHLAANSVGTGAMLYAMYVMYDLKESDHKKHLQSNHAYLGLLTGGALVAQTGAGLFAYFFPAKSPMEQRKRYNIHRKFGTATVVIFATTVATGASQTFTKSVPVRLAAIASVALGAVSILHIVVSKHQQPQAQPQN